LRWYWWRINAWSEVSAMVVAAAVSLFLQLGWPGWETSDQRQFAYVMLSTVAVTTVAWVAVTLLTRPEPREVLTEFYARVRPAGPGWNSVRGQVAADAGPSESLGVQFVNWALGCVLIYASLFGIGYLIFKEWAWGVGLTVVALACAAAISRNMSKVVRHAAPLAVLMLATVSFSARLCSAAPPAGDTEKVFLGYVYSMPENIRYELYTHLCHAFVVADEAGHLKPNNRVPSRELTDQAHQAGVKVLLSLGGWGWDKQFAAMVADGLAEDRYVDAVMRLVDEFDYDGIDLDWEYPDTPAEVAGFERLATRLRAKLNDVSKKKNRPMLLTMAASASPKTLEWLDADFLLRTMDWVNVMTYDYTGEQSPFAGHHSPLFASTKVPAESRESTELTMKYLVEQRRMPPDRLTVGLPLYGKGFAAAEPYGPTNKSRADRRRGGNYARLHELATKEGWRRTRDDETKNPWLTSPDGTTVIGYDDAESLALRTEWTMKQGFRGVFFWQVAGDRLPDGSNPLQQAAHDAWAKTSDAVK
jgi:chitinase